MKKIILSVLFVLSVLIGTVISAPGTIQVQAEVVSYENCEYYEYVEGLLVLKSCTDRDIVEMVIPSEIDGKKVTEIGYSAFAYCDNLSSIEIPDSVISIDSLAFYACDSLTNIEIPDSVRSIGGYAFYGTPWLGKMIADNQYAIVNSILISGGIKSGNIEIPDSVKYIGEFAFVRSGDLESIKIPSSVKGIWRGAFSLCSNLKDVYYSGSESEWNQIYISYDSNNCLRNVNIHYNSSMPSIPDNTDTGNTDTDNPFKTEDNNVATITLSSLIVTKPSVTYTGKLQTPAVTVTDTNGQVVDSANYTIAYTNNKNVGQAAVTVTGTGNYTGTLTAAFQILPKGTSLSKLSGKKKAFSVKWKKQSVQTTGYQVQYAQNAAFKGAKSITVKKNQTVSSTVKKLKAKKKYYVRIRTYKNVKINGKTVKLYSNWSKAKTVTTGK